MNSPLITTKLFIPPIRHDLLSRSRLLNKIKESAEYPILLLSAPAGSGKSTLIAEWAGKSNQPIAWISLEADDNDPAQFLSYLISALHTIQKDVSGNTLENLLSSQIDSFEAVVINLINEIANIPGSFSVVFDDFHTITDPKINHLVTLLIDHRPPQMHLVFATRIDPPWPLTRYRARNLIYEIRGHDLQFTLQEATEFLCDSMDLNLSVDQIAALEKRTEGWAVGLQLAAISMQGEQDIPGFIEEFTGSHTYIAEYLIEELLKKQPKEIQDFLIQTSILDRLNGSLCESVIGCHDGQATLNSFYKANLFTMPLDHKGIWFRYHHLFSDLLRTLLKQRYSQDEVAALHNRAANWYKNHNYAIEAINHLLAAENFNAAIIHIEETARQLIFNGRTNTLRKWLESFPESSFHRRPQLAFYSFWIDLLQGNADLSAKSIQNMERLLETLPASSNNDKVRGELTSVICRALALSGQTTQAIRVADNGLNILADDDQASRARLYSGLAIALDLEGRSDEALPNYKESYTFAIAAGDYLLTVNTEMAKGLAQYYCGQLNNAADIFQSVIDINYPGKLPALSSKKGGHGDVDSYSYHPGGPGYIGLGQVYLEWNDLRTAEQNLLKGLELCRLGGQDGLFLGRLNLSRLRQAQGDLDKAFEQIDFPVQDQKSLNVYRIISRKIKIALAAGNVDQATKLADPFFEIINEESSREQIPILFYEKIQAAVARVYIAQGETNKAISLLDNLRSTASNTNRIGRMVEVYLLRALAIYKQDHDLENPKVINNLIQALTLAYEPGFIMLFLEEGQVLIPLLQQVIKESDSPDIVKGHAKKMLAAFGDQKQKSGPFPSLSPSQIAEKLTPREIEVLHRVAAGESNKEIAEKLVITVRTVKKHTSNIYGKLGVSSRTQAVVYAQEIGLLSSD